MLNYPNQKISYQWGKNWVYLGGKPGKDSKRLSFPVLPFSNNKNDEKEDEANSNWTAP